jgi:hypothetical protein
MLVAGLVLDSVARGRAEMKRMHYLAYPARSGMSEVDGNGQAGRAGRAA